MVPIAETGSEPEPLFMKHLLPSVKVVLTALTNS